MELHSRRGRILLWLRLRRRGWLCGGCRLPHSRFRASRDLRLHAEFAFAYRVRLRLLCRGFGRGRPLSRTAHTTEQFRHMRQRNANSRHSTHRARVAARAPPRALVAPRARPPRAFVAARPRPRVAVAALAAALPLARPPRAGDAAPAAPPASTHSAVNPANLLALQPIRQFCLTSSCGCRGRGGRRGSRRLGRRRLGRRRPGRRRLGRGQRGRFGSRFPFRLLRRRLLRRRRRSRRSSARKQAASALRLADQEAALHRTASLRGLWGSWPQLAQRLACFGLSAVRARPSASPGRWRRADQTAASPRQVTSRARQPDQWRRAAQIAAPPAHNKRLVRRGRPVEQRGAYRGRRSCGRGADSAAGAAGAACHGTRTNAASASSRTPTSRRGSSRSAARGRRRRCRGSRAGRR